VNLVVIAKEPRPGHVKTRLCPPCTPVEAAALAEAALADTLAAALGSSARDVILALHGEPGPWLPSGVRVVPQRGRGLDERLAAAFDDAGGPSLLIGMDTPQVTSELLDTALSSLDGPRLDAVIGAADDGGWWALGLRRPDRRAFLGVPMSAVTTHDAQRRRLVALGLRIGHLPGLRDVDTFDDARVVADEIPGSRFAARVAATTARWVRA